jgi:hypothetical protein
MNEGDREQFDCRHVAKRRVKLSNLLVVDLTLEGLSCSTHLVREIYVCETEAWMIPSCLLACR